MAFPRIALAILSRNGLLGQRLRAAPRILSQVSQLNTPAGSTRFWRTYSDASASTKGRVNGVDKNSDLFGEDPTGETELVGIGLEESSPLGLQQERVDPGETDEELEVERSEVADATNSSRYISRGKLMAAHRARVMPELKEDDLEEMFVRGSGPGGQAINKTSSSVSLIHRPTGIRVQCQATRSREQNRKIARKIMLDKLDQLANPGLSKLEVQQEKVRAKKRQRAKKAKKKAKLRADTGSVAEDEN